MFKKHQLDHQRKKNMSSKNKMNFPESRTPFVNSKRPFKKKLEENSSLDLSWKLQYIITFISLKFSSRSFTYLSYLKVGTTGCYKSSPEVLSLPSARPPGDATLSAHPNNFVVSGFAVPKSKWHPRLSPVSQHVRVVELLIPGFLGQIPGSRKWMDQWLV